MERKLLILIAEAEHKVAYAYQLSLLERGHRVNVVHSAEDALETITPEFDLVITDLRLPEMTGEQMILSMRAQPALEDLPVLVIAAAKTLPDSLVGRATTLRRKPFDVEALPAYVSSAAGRSRFRN